MVEDKKYLISESELKEFKAMSVWTHGFAESAEMDPIGKATKDFLKSKTPIEPSDDAIEAEIREILYDFHSTGSTVTPEDFDKAVFQLSTLTPKAQEVIADIYGTVNIDHTYGEVVIERDGKKWFPSDLIKDQLTKKVRVTITEVNKDENI